MSTTPNKSTFGASSELQLLKTKITKGEAVNVVLQKSEEEQVKKKKEW